MGLPPPAALFSPRDEDLHVNEDRRKRKICLSFRASVRKTNHILGSFHKTGGPPSPPC